MRFPFLRRLRAALPTVARRTLPRLELLEGRDLPSTFVVTNTSDSAAPGSGSLRRAILDSNANPPASGANLIQFNIPGSGPQTITPAPALPTVTAPAFIDGATQPGFLAANAPQVVLDGSGVNGNGLTLAADSCTVRGLVIDNFKYGIGVNIESSGNTLVANFIGTDPTGTQAALNSFGVVVSPAAGSIQDNFLLNNVISGNGAYGVYMSGSVTVTVISGDLIGTDVTGTQPLGNANNNIVAMHGASQTLIGSNVISASLYGVFFGDGPGGNVVANNLIGTDVTGTRLLSNSATNVVCEDDGGDTVRANVICGGGGEGVALSGGATAGDLVVGNLIGTGLYGTQRLGNRGAGVSAAAPHSIIAGNVISGNAGDGVELAGPFSGTVSTDILVQGNRIGTDAASTAALPNNLAGVELLRGVQGNTLDSNLIAGNGQDGVLIRDGGTTGNTVERNLIGVTVVGAALSNGLHGVEIDNAASGNTVSGNNVQFNGGHGILLHDAGTTGNTVTGNDSSFNAGAGVIVAAGAAGNTVGGTSSGQGNVLDGNGQAGAWVADSGTSAVPVEGNSIFGNGVLGGIALTGGANNNQAPPTLVYAVSAGPNNASVSGTLHAAASTLYRVEFFDSPSADGQGQTFLGFLNVTTDGDGNATFLDDFAGSLTSLTATATGPNGNTSMFSAPVAVARL